jgi:hypothetical protein
MATAKPTPVDDFDRKLLADIDRVGWAVIGIPEDDEGPGYAFSIGLHRTFEHPEVILIGLPWEVSYRLLNLLGAGVKSGNRYEAGREYDDLVEGYPSTFLTVDRRHYKDYLGTAGWFYRGWDFPVLQMVWCDRDRSWPWQRGKPRAYWRRQPLLGKHVKRSAGRKRRGE